VRSKIDLEPALSNTPCKQIQPLSRIKTLNGPRVRGISPVGEEKVYGEIDLPKSQVLSSDWKTERVREDASGDADSEDGEEDDDESVVSLFVYIFLARTTIKSSKFLINAKTDST